MSRLLTIATAIVLSTQLSHATGFEKESLWSGEHGGKAGAAVSSSHGPESLYFNPARIGKTESRQTLSLDFSPTWAKFESPMGSPQSGHESKMTLSPVFGLSYGHKFNDDFAVGLGSHVVGGTNIEYDNVAFGNYTDGHFKSFLSIIEVAAGGSYKVTDAFSVGLAWRGTFFTTDYHAVYGDGTVAAQTDFSDMKGSDFSGIRLGLDYEPSDKWGIALKYQTEVGIEATGELQQTAYLYANGSQVGSLTDGDAKLRVKLPASLTIGGHYQLNEQWKLFGEYTWIDYSRMKEFELEGTSLNGPLQNLRLKWKDQNVIRIAGEYTGWKLPLRAGYAYSSEVTPRTYASPNYLGPGSGHLVSVGSGYALIEGLQLNGAVEYFFQNGSVSTADATADGTNFAPPGVGDYKTTVFPTIHLGMTYNF